MQNQQKCYENVWILSGTSDGPPIVEGLLQLNYVVFVSVISDKAASVYSKNPKLHIITGKLLGEEKVKNFIIENSIDHIIDATHPFAINISKSLSNVCNLLGKKLHRYERFNDNINKTSTTIISDLYGIKDSDLVNKNLLLAIGSRSLGEVAKYYCDMGANVFARIIATQDSILNAFASSIKSSNLAILNPSKSKTEYLETELCNFWKIDYILCRDSGGYSQMIWEENFKQILYYFGMP